MLITFRVANFLSFNEEEEFSMLAGKQRKPVRPAVPLATGVEALKLAVIYGANASGKSNLVRSINFGQKIILDGLKHIAILDEHFRLQKENKEKPTKFEFEFEIQGKIYAYGYVLNLSKKLIEEEWLFEIKKTKQKPVFERIVEKSGKSKITSQIALKTEEEIRFSIYAEDLQSNELFINILGQKSWPKDSFFSIYSSVFHWFSKKLLVVYTSTKLDAYNSISAKAFNSETFNYKKFFCEMLSFFGTGISDIELIEEEGGVIIDQLPENQKNIIIEKLNNGMDSSVMLGKKRYYLSMNAEKEIISSYFIIKHNSNKKEVDASFHFEDESDGTKRLFDFIPILKVLSMTDITIVIDEIDRSLHPELLHKLIEYYLASTANINSQLIVTSHESSLLDLKLLRRDEIWFVEKNNQGESHIYSLEEFQPRFDKEIRKAYLLGRYGAIPFISDVQQLNWEIANAEG